MVNYNQKYKNDVIVTIQRNDGYNYDNTVSDNRFFSAVGQKTSGNLDSISRVDQIVLSAVKPDTILNFESGTVKVYDDDGNLGSQDLSNLRNQQWSSLVINLPRYLHFNSRDNNIRFDDFNPLDGMTKDIDGLMDSENVKHFNLKTTTPSDVKCNYTTGSHSYIKGQAVNVTFDGNIRKGDKIVIKRNTRNDSIANIKFDTDFIFSNLGFDGVTNAEFIYSHGDTPQPPKPLEKTTVEFTSSDDGIQWQNATMVDSGSNFINPVIIQKGYELRKKLVVELTKKDGTVNTLSYGDDTVYFDGDDNSRNKWNLTIPSEYVKINIKAGNTTYKQYELSPTLQNAKIIDPKPVEDDYGKQRYYLSPKQNHFTIQANDGYTFENDGSLTYQRDLLDQETMTIKANHSNTITVTLPNTINWSVQQDLMLTMGAIKAQIVENTGGFTNIYKADYTNLLKFSNEVIIKITSSGSSSSVQSYDVTPYINNLVMLPFDVPSGEPSAIVAGNETFNTKLPTVDDNYLTVDLGKIKVDEQYKNGFDYYQVKTRLMLPYTDMIELDPIHVINQTINIKYFVNIINGDTTINLLNNADVFYSKQVNLANEVPFISSATKGSQYAVINQLKTMFRNGIKQAYLIIEQPTPILNSEYYSTNEKGMLKGYTGNVKAELINNVTVPNDEFNTLQNLLRNGVKIK